MRPGYLEAMADLGGTNEAIDLLLDAVPYGVFVDHVERGCIYASAEALRMFEMSWEEFRGFGWASAVLEADMETLREAIERYEKEKTRIEVQYRIRVADGSVRAIHVHGHAVLGADGEQLGSVMIGREVTLERAEKDRLVQSQKLEAIGRLAGRVAHDFNNVLTPIICSASLLEERADLDEDARESVTTILEGVEHAAAITKQLLGLSRQDVGAPRVARTDQEIQKLRPLLAQLMGERVRVAVDLGADSAVIGLAPHELGQVLLNLCVNARDAVDGEGETRIVTRRRGDELELRVADTGRGIPVDVQERMFDPFFTTKPADRGTGLGLSTVRELILRAGGSVAVRSELGTGTEIAIRLPLVGSFEPGVSVAPTARSLEPLRVLLVDDNSALRQTLAYVLALRRHEVETAATCERARELLASREFDVLVSDVLLQDGRGDELASEAMARSPSLAVVFISGFAGESFDAASVAEGRSTFLQKPFHPNRLISAIADAVHREAPVRSA